MIVPGLFVGGGVILVLAWGVWGMLRGFKKEKN